MPSRVPETALWTVVRHTTSMPQHYTLKRNDHAGFWLLLVVVGRRRKARSDLRKRVPETVGRRRPESVSAGLLADYLRTGRQSRQPCCHSSE